MLKHSLKLTFKYNILADMGYILWGPKTVISTVKAIAVKYHI